MAIVRILIFVYGAFALDFRSNAYKELQSLPAPNTWNNQEHNPYQQLAPAPQIPHSYNQISSAPASPVQPVYQQNNGVRGANSEPIQGYIVGNMPEQQPVISFPMSEMLKQNFTQPVAVFQPAAWKTPIAQYSNLNNPTTTTTSKPIPTTTTTVQYYTFPTYKTTTAPRHTPPTATPLVWTTTRSSKMPAKMSRLNAKPVKKEGNGAAHVSVPSHRLLNDILVIPSSRRLYILAIFPIHESADNQGFECGRVDVNGFVRLGAFLDALEKVNSQRVLKDAGLQLGAVIVDSCSSDLRTVADLYELLSGTNIQKADIIAMVRDDGSHLPNVDEFARHLKIPIINTFFTTGDHLHTTGTLPSISSPLEAMLALLTHTGSSCVSLVYDELHFSSSLLLAEMALQQGICLEHSINLKGGGKVAVEGAVRRMLLTEARVAVVLLSEGNWIELMKAFRTEMVIAGRFILLTTQEPRWFTSKQFLEMWPHFDQLLLSIAVKKPQQHHELTQLTSLFPTFPFPQHWLRQFWSTAFKCHVEGENEKEQFSKECGNKQLLNLTAVAPDIDIAPVTLAVYTVAHAVRRLVDNICPGALIQVLNDCLNDPLESLFGSIMTSRFDHHLSAGGVTFNDTTGYRDAPLVVNRVVYSAQLEVEEIAEWDTVFGFSYTAPADLVMEERDGTRVPLRSQCPKSTCAAELARRSQAGVKPRFKDGLSNVFMLIYTIGAVLAFFSCMMCMYHHIISMKADTYRVCTVFMIGGLSFLCLVSITFIMPPTAVSCSLRRILFSTGLAAVFAPILIKTLVIWRKDILNKDSVNSGSRTSSGILLGMCTWIVLLQLVIAVEWAIFENPTELSFSYSIQHGQGWRCNPGDKFEQRLLHSCGLIGLMIILTLICSVLSVKHVECMQNILISVISIVMAMALYLGLPLLPYKTRDIVTASVLLLFAALLIIITYCRGAFARRDADSTRNSLMEKSSTEPSEKNPFWLDNHVLSPRGQNTLARSYQGTNTLPNPHHAPNMDRYSQYGAPMYGTARRGPAGPQQVVSYDLVDSRTMPRSNNTLARPPSQHKYGVEAYELPPSESPVPTRHNQGGNKYGNQEYVLEEEGGHSRL